MRRLRQQWSLPHPELAVALKILHIEDDLPDAELVLEALRAAGLDPDLHRIETREQLDASLQAGGFDLVLSDYRLPRFDGLAALDMVRQRAPDLPFIMVTGSLGDESAVEVIKRGASDFVVKENLKRLEEAVLRALRESDERRVRRLAEHRQRLLMRELDHRVKNNLAAIISLCEQMLQDAGSVKEFGAAFTGRLHNMARLQQALAQSSWQGATVRDLIALTVGPLTRDANNRLSVDVPDRLLPPAVASALSMILYELAVNAAKHGALSNHEGRMQIKWAEVAGSVTLTWTEQAGRPLRPPAEGPEITTGHGMQLIEGFARHELGGVVKFDFRPEGLLFTATFASPATSSVPEVDLLLGEPTTRSPRISPPLPSAPR